MRTKISLARDGELYVLRLTVPQVDLIESLLVFMDNRPESDLVLRVWIGCTGSQISLLRGKVASSEASRFSIDELHTLLAALVVVPTLFSCEEDFYIKIGFFKENSLEVSLGLASAMKMLDWQVLGKCAILIGGPRDGRQLPGRSVPLPVRKLPAAVAVI
ncbi:hypothetical protein AB0878_27190 [Amycolatopsis sp. NPDC047767]|uniref:hypothetical protein n=2 Tax=Amycolatopsis TaxID=1813 RepID=UPI0034539F79